MSNQQVYPSSTYPISGDAQSTPGSSTVTVVGIQQVPVDPTPPQPQQILVAGSDGVWHPEDPIVSGPDPTGAPPSSANPVQVAGWDAVDVREILTDPQGAVVASTQAGLGEQLQSILQELRAIKSAIINLDNTAVSSDYDSQQYTDLATTENVVC